MLPGYPGTIYKYLIYGNFLKIIFSYPGTSCHYLLYASCGQMTHTQTKASLNLRASLVKIKLLHSRRGHDYHFLFQSTFHQHCLCLAKILTHFEILNIQGRYDHVVQFLDEFPGCTVKAFDKIHFGLESWLSWLSFYINTCFCSM